MSLQNILGNMLSGLAGQVAQGQGKAEPLEIEGLSEEFVGAFRQATEELAVLKSQSLKQGGRLPETATQEILGQLEDSGASNEEQSGVEESEEELLEEYIASELANWATIPDPLKPELGQTDLMAAGVSDFEGQAEGIQSQPGRPDSIAREGQSENLDTGDLIEGKSQLVKATPQAKAVLAELMGAEFVQVSMARTISMVGNTSDPLGATGKGRLSLAEFPRLPEMPDLPTNVRTMLEEKGFTFEAGSSAAELDLDVATTQTDLKSTTEKETVNNPASSKAGGVAVSSEATLLPASFSSVKEGQGVKTLTSAGTAVGAVQLPNSAASQENPALQSIAISHEGEKSAENKPVSNTAGLEQAVGTLKDMLKTVPDASKPALQEVLDKLQTRLDSTESVSADLASVPGSEMQEGEASETPSFSVNKIDSRMFGSSTSSPLSPPAANSVEGSLGVDPVVHSHPGLAGREPLNTLSVRGAAGSSVTDQVVNAATFSVQNGRKEVTLQLNPHDLGDVRVRLSSDAASQVSARLIATSVEGHELLSHQIEGLQKSMEAQGIRVERIQVVLAGEGAQNHAEDQSRSDTSQPGTQQQAFQDMAQQHYHRGQQEHSFMGAGRPGHGVPVEGAGPGFSEGVEAEVSESQNDHGRVSLLI